MAVETRVVFGSGFEALFSKDFRTKVTPQLEKELSAVGVRLDRPFNPAYSVEVWSSVLSLCAKHLYADDSLPEAYRKLGRSTVVGFGETFMGKALFPLLRLIGPVRALDRAARSYASTNNYTKVVLTQISPTCFDFYLNEKHTLPEYDMGVIEEMLTHLHVPSPRVNLQAQDTEGFTMRLEWN
jgi:uncharacterized protein (TIGR02265 family)